MASFISIEDVEDRIGSARLIQIFDQNLDGNADEIPLAAAITDANAEIYARLNKKGYTEEQIEELSRDETLRRAAANIVAEFGAYMKPELIGDKGETMYTPLADKSRTLIDSIAASTFRPRAEKTAGPPATMSAQYTQPSPDFYVAPSADRPRGPGRF